MLLLDHFVLNHFLFLISDKIFLILFTAGKSSVLMDVKPWDDETDMKKLEEAVRSVQMEGLFWGACMFLFPITKCLFIMAVFGSRGSCGGKCRKMK